MTTSTDIAIPPPEKSILQRLRETVEFGEKLRRENKVNRAVTIQIIARMKVAMRPLFGEGSQTLQKLNTLQREAVKSTDLPSLFAGCLDELMGCVKILQLISGSESLSPISSPSLPPITKNIFIIHGHDETNLLRLKDILREQFKLNPIAILAGAGLSKSIIDKFESYAETCSYAIALYTPDDHVTTPQSQQIRQARPNVIFETGWFVGRLGIARVLLLLKDGTEIHSDLGGLNRVQFKENVSENFLEIKRELEAAAII